MWREWPARHRLELSSPYIRDPDRARRILLQSPWPDQSTAHAVQVAGAYWRETGSSRRRETVMAEVLALPAEVRRAFAAWRGYSDDEVSPQLPYPALRPAYTDCGIEEAIAHAWHRARIGPANAAEWTANGFSCAEAQDWRTVVRGAAAAARWRDHGFDLAATRHWIEDLRFDDPAEASAFTAGGVGEQEAVAWSRLPARTALWWRARGHSFEETMMWITELGHSDRTSRAWALSGMSLQEAMAWYRDRVPRDEALRRRQAPHPGSDDDWRRRGFASTDAGRWRTHGFTAEEAARARHGSAFPEHATRPVNWMGPEDAREQGYPASGPPVT